MNLHKVKYLLKSIIIVLVTVIVSLFSNVSLAQDSYLLYGLKNIPQSTYLNPAFQSEYEYFIGIPGLSNLQVGYLNSVTSYNQLFYRAPGSDSLYFDLNKIITPNLNKKGYTAITLDQDILFAGFKVQKTRITFGIRQRLMIGLHTDNDFFKLIWNGNAPYLGKTLNLSHTFINLVHFIDYHAGLSIPVLQNVRVGVRAHLLQGLSNINTVNDKLTLTTLDRGNNIEVLASTAFSINTSGLSSNTRFNTSTYFNNFMNFGFGIDLGIDAKLSNNFEISASVLDLGKINYRSNTQNYKSKEDSIYFNGLNISLVNSSLANIGDTLKNIFHVTSFPVNYSAKLPTRLLFSATYFTSNRKNKISLLFSTRFLKDYNVTAIMLGYDAMLSRHFNIKVNYMYLKESPLNIGAVISVKLKPLQFYLYSDNLLGVNWKKARYLQAGLGINILITKKK